MIGILIIVAILGIAVLLATFDANRYRPLVTKQLSAALGKPVRLGHLSLGWRGGLALELNELTVYEQAEGQGEPALEIETAAAVVHLLPLLRKDVELSSIVLVRPRLTITRSAQGALTVGGVSIPQQASGASLGSSAVGAQAAPLLFIKRLQITDGFLRFRDATAQPPMDIAVKDIDVTLQPVSLTRPIGVQVRCALFSETQNIDVSGRIRLPLSNQPARVEQARLATDLSRLRVAELGRAAPAIQSLGLKEPLAGHLTISVDRLTLSPEGLADAAVQVRLSDGRIAPADLGSPVEEVTVEARAAPQRVELSRASAKVAGGSLTLTGAVNQLKTRPQSTLQLRIERVALDTLLPSPPSGAPSVRGHLSATLEGTAEGLTWPSIQRSLSGRGNVALQDGVIVNLNIVREVFSKLSMLPGVMEALEARLPESYKAKFAARDTVLQPIELPMRVDHGAVVFERLRAATDAFELDGSGSVGLDGAVMSQAQIRIEPELSAAMIQGMQELHYLANAEGRLELPVRMYGTLPHVAVLPDLQYVASRLLGTQAQQILGHVLKRALAPRGAAPEEAAPSSPATSAPPAQESPASETSDLLENVLRRVIEKKLRSKEPTAP